MLQTSRKTPADLCYPDELIDELAKEIESAMVYSLNESGKRETDQYAKGLLLLLLGRATIKIGNKVIKF